jgi:hypothetical protein
VRRAQLKEGKKLRRLQKIAKPPGARAPEAAANDAAAQDPIEQLDVIDIISDEWSDSSE